MTEESPNVTNLVPSIGAILRLKLLTLLGEVRRGFEYLPRLYCLKPTTCKLCGIVVVATAAELPAATAIVSICIYTSGTIRILVVIIYISCTTAAAYTFLSITGIPQTAASRFQPGRNC